MDAVLERPAATDLGLLPRLRGVARRIAPVWPLADFVAVNPFHGMAGEPWGEGLARLRATAGVETLPDRALIAQALAEGRITDADLAEAIAEAGAATTPSALRLLAAAERPPARPLPQARTVAEVLDAALGTRWSALLAEEIAKWCAAWSDASFAQGGQASWPMPWRGEALYAAWRAAARHDRTPEVMGLKGFRAAVTALPEAPVESIAACLAAIGLREADAEPYLERALRELGGFAALLRQRGWAAELGGAANDLPLELLAIRLAWDAALFARHDAPAFRAAWAARLAAPPAPPPSLAGDLLLQAAYERHHQKALAARLAPPAAPRTGAPAVQAAFCIDVRSEVFRRALEETAPEVETIGFAGFFGFAIDYLRLGDAEPVAQYPVLLAPALTICESVEGAGAPSAREVAAARTLRRRVADAWAGFRSAAVSSFAYVETAGLLAAGKLLGATLGRARRDADGLDPVIAAALAPSLEPCAWAARPNGFAPAARLDAAEAVLRAMSLTKGFAPIVLLAGHGSSTVNNPHAAGLDCGACGGHTGESNARLAARVLNDPAVRRGLVARGIEVPAATRFVAAQHDTTTDEVTLFDVAPDDPALAPLRRWLADAARRARRLRAPLLGLAGLADPTPAIRRRTTDWSEVRPEWALAGNAAFIAAPRARTAGRDLEGRAFLHSYAWQEDRGFGVLELIMTAPMVVANWINLQYYASVVDNRAFGSGNKTLHNVVGRLGVLEGQGGDLRTGLPMQSVHDGVRWMHEPMRLSVIIEAPEDAMEAVLAKHPLVRDLVRNGWLHLFSLSGEGGALRRFHAPGDWRAFPG
jgi:uncharacterized protein YbcC (UPF0753/DUF2309 family)